MLNDFNTLSVKDFIEKYGIITKATYDKLVQADEIAMKQLMEQENERKRKATEKRKKATGVITNYKY